MNGLERVKISIISRYIKDDFDILFQQTKESFINMELKRELKLII
jgi:hypothetical protein